MRKAFYIPMLNSSESWLENHLKLVAKELAAQQLRRQTIQLEVDKEKRALMPFVVETKQCWESIVRVLNDLDLEWPEKIYFSYDASRIGEEEELVKWIATYKSKDTIAAALWAMMQAGYKPLGLENDFAIKKSLKDLERPIPKDPVLQAERHLAIIKSMAARDDSIALNLRAQLSENSVALLFMDLNHRVPESAYLNGSDIEMKVLDVTGSYK